MALGYCFRGQKIQPDTSFGNSIIINKITILK